MQIQRDSQKVEVPTGHGLNIGSILKLMVTLIGQMNLSEKYKKLNNNIMGIFDWLSGKSKQPKKGTTTELTDYHKHWLGLVDMRVNAVPLDSIKEIHTVDSYGEKHFNEYKLNEHRVPKDEREEVAKSRVDGLLSIKDYIKSNGSEEQKFHYKSSLKGAELYASSLRINPDLIELKDEFVFDFNQVLDIFKLHLDMDQVFEQIDNHIKKIDSNKKLDEIQRKEVGKTEARVNMESDLEKQEKLFKELFLMISFHPEALKNWLNDFAYNQFEQNKYNEGLNLVAQCISLHIMGSSETNISESDAIPLAGYLDTFSLGLYLKGNYEDALKISNILISLSPNHNYSSEHLTNRGKSKLKLDDKEGAKLDFEKALEKDENFEEAKNSLQILNQSNEKDVVSKNEE